MLKNLISSDLFYSLLETQHSCILLKPSFESCLSPIANMSVKYLTCLHFKTLEDA